MHCDEILEQMSAALDGELSAAERSVLDCHLAACPRCNSLYGELAGQSRALRALDCDVPEDLSGRILAALPPQTTAKKAPIVHLRRWGTLAACLVLACCGAFAFSGPSADKAARADMASNMMSPAACAPAPSSALEIGLASPETEAPAEEARTESILRAVRYERMDWTEELTNSALLLTADEAAALLPEGTDVSAARFIAVTLTENSGSVSHTVEDVTFSDGSCQVLLSRNVPEAGTCDMAAWRILIEVDPVFPEGTPVILTVQ